MSAPTSKNAPHIDVVRLEDKETKLKSFIKAFIERTPSATVGGEAPVLLLVLRSLDSPVAKAVTALMQERALDMPVRAIIAMIERPEVAALASEDSTGAPAAFTLDNVVRLARDTRLLDVHEQMILGPSTSWIGDCMRRDPRKRDAYECYAADCAKTASWARISFDRLWSKSEPIAAVLAIDAATAEACAVIAGEVAADAHDGSTVS